MARRTHLNVRLPNPVFWLNPMAVWEYKVHRAALRHIERVNEGIISEILSLDYAEREPITSHVEVYGAAR